VRRITRPLAALVEATREIDRGATNVQVAVQGQDEVATLAVSFNQMVARQEDYTHRLEEQAQELERAHTRPGPLAKWFGKSAPSRPWKKCASFCLTN
jgi:nitrogen fixation/metabolism regulation signal transduction histidine kinase